MVDTLTSRKPVRAPQASGLQRRRQKGLQTRIAAGTPERPDLPDMLDLPNFPLEPGFPSLGRPLSSLRGSREALPSGAEGLPPTNLPDPALDGRSGPDISPEAVALPPTVPPVLAQSGEFLPETSLRGRRTSAMSNEDPILQPQISNFIGLKHLFGL
jgi:hypothetical protein